MRYIRLYIFLVLGFILCTSYTSFSQNYSSRIAIVGNSFDNKTFTKKEIHSISEILYEKGYSALDIIEYIKDLDIETLKKYEYLVYIQKIKKEFREEKLLMSSILHFLLKRSDYTLENITFM